MPRTYVLDTNVLLHDPRALFVFEEHTVVIPITVIEEIDQFKKNLDETGHNARQVSRYLDDLRAQGSLGEGVDLENGGRLLIDLCQGEAFDQAKTADDRILLVASTLSGSEDAEVVLVSRDTNMRIKGDAMGVLAQDYRHDQVIRNDDEHYTGLEEHEVDSSVIDDIHSEGRIHVDRVDETLHPNVNLVLRSGQQSALARVDPRAWEITRTPRFQDGIWGITPRNKEQMYALALLLDDRLPLVTLAGRAGTGKTLIAIAAGLKLVADDSKYRKLLVARPIFPMGRDIGYLPGDIDAKLDPWMKPIYDNLELLVSTHGNTRGGGKSYDYLFDTGLMEVEPLTYIRGRSIPQQFMIIDEAQNLTRHEVKTILTRAGEGTKIVLTGDPAQIDNPYVDHSSNGLTYAIERFKGSPLAGHITLVKGERSALADAASKLL